MSGVELMDQRMLWTGSCTSGPVSGQTPGSTMQIQTCQVWLDNARNPPPQLSRHSFTARLGEQSIKLPTIVVLPQLVCYIGALEGCISNTSSRPLRRTDNDVLECRGTRGQAHELIGSGGNCQIPFFFTFRFSFITEAYRSPRSIRLVWARTRTRI